ncbi:TOMM precursor leader peptide-binding protein [Streptomyces sedi]|uniref:TOMM leader peptide-binding protein n=1 Tax=Streptomyces sedi TaxID=555059 RepID=A0A5C4V464_9ACTN|nr:TOMM precursor leader peptide-binding protein [Streptomyces sedi]TNM30573.1 TOMM precursor leader peptide-binding protein [Streptomyces sedi]
MVEPTPPPSPVLLGLGAFGLRVTRLLADSLPTARVVDADTMERALRERPGPLVVASWRPAPGLCERADGLAYALGVPWLPVIDEHPAVLVGPHVTPPGGPCFGCYRDRCAQHDQHHRDTEAVHRAYDRDPGLGPTGYLPAHARVAAGIALGMLRRPGAYPGRVVRIAKQDMSLHGHPVIPRHGCPRCAPVGDRPEPALPALLDAVYEEAGDVR